MIKEHNDPLMTNTEGAVSWSPLMITIIVVQFFKFLLLRRIIHLYERKKSEMAFSNVNDTEAVEAESDVYEKRFYNDRWWTLVVAAIGYLAVGIYALLYPA